MINIEVTSRNGEMEIYSVGHANYNPGNDIICSAVSAIMQTAAFGLQKLSEQYPDNISFKLVDK
jgi:uncharacterized protein YsxB (DUF464 family)